MEQKIYAVRDNNRDVVGGYFAKKMAAKAVRNKMNSEGRDVYVTNGPDHPNYNPTLKPNAIKRRKSRKK
jgi:hypothetical protein